MGAVGGLVGKALNLVGYALLAIVLIALGFLVDRLRVRARSKA